MSKLHYDYQKYIEKRNEAKRQIRLAVKEHEKKISKESKTNCKGFWKYVNNKLKRNTGISNLKTSDGKATENDKEKADLLNSFFSSVFTKENTTNIPDLNHRNNEQFICDLIITREAVEEKLSRLDPHKSMGPDKIPAFLLKSLSKELSLPLCIIFNKSISEGKLPQDWKKAEVTAIFKKGNKTDPGNYRPVSLTSIICKVLESFIRDQIQDYMEKNNFITSCQHGFRKHRSCVTQLLEVMNDLTNFHENSDSIDIIYMDFAKAFDSVPHKRLINKLKSYGIEGNILNWISDFLNNRSQTVKVNNALSDPAPVVSGIPQGSILGPLLFIIFINDLPDCVQSICKIFADDTKVYNSHKNYSILQNDLYKLLDWAREWDLNFNLSKCHVLHMGKRNNKNVYYMDRDKTVKLDTTLSEKDVGVTFSTDLKFDIHIGNIVKKANQLTGLIKRSFLHLDQSMFRDLFKSIVRPHLEYANVIWHPLYKRQASLIEGVQRRATKLI